MDPLRVFYNNEVEREAVKLYMIDCLKELAVEQTFDGKEVTGIKEAYDTITKAFDKLDGMYGKIERIVDQNSR